MCFAEISGHYVFGFGLIISPVLHSDLEVNNRQIMTGAHHCAESECMGCADECIVCSHCLSETGQNSIRDSIREHFHRVNTRRVFPPAGKVSQLPIALLFHNCM